MKSNYLLNKVTTPQQIIEVRIPWVETTLNETCVFVIKHFGNPGKKYNLKTDEEYIYFYFKESQDALFFSLKWE